MDPLHPLRDIQPVSAPAPVNPFPIQRTVPGRRVERERDSPPDRERTPEEESDGGQDDLEDAYDPEWERPDDDDDAGTHIDISV